MKFYGVVTLALAIVQPARVYDKQGMAQGAQYLDGSLCSPLKWHKKTSHVFYNELKKQGYVNFT